MDDKIRYAANTPEQSSPATAEPPTRRRKRRYNTVNNNTLGSLSTPSKRLAKEKASIAIASMHNGPYTRAVAASFTPPPASKSSLVDTVPLSGGEAVDSGGVDDEGCVGVTDWQALEDEVEAEFRAIKSRDVNVHVVPTHCGWFSWTEVHPLEEQTLSSFFSKKSEDRTSDMYLEIRNWIMKRYHANPNTQIEAEDLSKLTVGDMHARQEVMEFLEHWGLINFHPFLPSEPLSTDANEDKAINNHSLIENLYRFEPVQSSPTEDHKITIAKPIISSRLFQEPAIVEDLVKPENPAPEYHCNSCSTDCSRKRYHCQTEADYDLCAECFINGKFGSTMSLSDFILMEPAEVPGVSGGNWTDQETLLLLEALELYKENWNEIAEHVSTKTKVQCILHFVQMPIEDTFFEASDEADTILQQNRDPTSTDDSTPKDTPVAMESKGITKESEDITMEVKDVPNEDQPSSLLMETSKVESIDGTKHVQESSENCAVKALREAFEAVGSLLPPEGPIKFVEAGNPVMALAAFLSRLVGPDTVTASSRCSVKSISSSSPGTMTALRHCFVLEDPPDEKREPVVSESSVADLPNSNSKNGDNVKEEKIPGPPNESDIKNIKGTPKDRKKSNSCKGAATKESAGVVSEGEAGHSNLNESEKNPAPNMVLPKDQQPSAVKQSDDTASKEEAVACSVKESADETSVKEHSRLKEEPRDAGNKHANASLSENHATPTKEDRHIDNVKRAAITALSAAAVKAKLLADQEEDHIRQLSAQLIDKQLHKLETKLACFSEMDSVVTRVKEQLERSKQRLYQERLQIIASRRGIQDSSSRPMQQSMATNRPPMNFSNAMPRPSMNMIPQRPFMSSRPMASFPPSSTTPLFPPTMPTGNSIRPSSQDQFSSMGNNDGGLNKSWNVSFKKNTTDRLESLAPQETFNLILDQTITLG